MTKKILFKIDEGFFLKFKRDSIVLYGITKRLLSKISIQNIVQFRWQYQPYFLLYAEYTIAIFWLSYWIIRRSNEKKLSLIIMKITWVILEWKYFFLISGVYPKNSFFMGKKGFWYMDSNFWLVMALLRKYL